MRITRTVVWEGTGQGAARRRATLSVGLVHSAGDGGPRLLFLVGTTTAQVGCELGPDFVDFFPGPLRSGNGYDWALAKQERWVRLSRERHGSGNVVPGSEAHRERS